MIEVTGLPQRNINNDPAYPSRWSSVHQPIQFSMCRKDIPFIIVNIGASGRCRIKVSDPVGLPQVGDTVYINSGSYVGNYEVTLVQSVFSPYYYDIELPFTGVSVGGYVNLVNRENYYVETVIYGVNALNQYYALGTSVNKPNAAGELIVDVSSWLKTLVSYNDTFAYDVLNKKDETSGGMYNIRYREVYDGVAQDYSAMSSTLVNYYVNSAKQIQEMYGANMGDYVPVLDQIDAKFMSDFVKPTYFKNYPFSLSFIYSDLVTGYEVFKFEKTKDLNNVEIATAFVELDNAQSQRVNRLMLTDFADAVKEVDVWLEFGVVSCVEYVVDDYAIDDYVELQCGVIEVETP